MNKIFFIAPVNYPKLEKRLGARLVVGAAYRKINGIILALRSGGSNSYLIASPVLSNCKQKYFPGGIEKKEHILRLPAFSFGPINRLMAAYFYLIYAFKYGNSSKFIFYNFYIEYIPAMVYLKFIGNSGHIDFEDLPIKKFQAREFINWVSLYACMLFMHDNFMAASSLIAEFIKKRNINYSATILHGVMDDEICMAYRNNIIGDPLRILHCGSINKNTGTDLLCDAIDFLANNNLNIGRIEFHVSGFGDMRRFNKYSEITFNNRDISVHVHDNMSVEGYKNLIASCDIGLCLKDPLSEYGRTTFPSKLLEFSANRIAIISLDFTDVKYVFNESILIIENNYLDLAEKILYLANNFEILDYMKLSANKMGAKLYSRNSIFEKIKFMLN